MTVTSNPTRSTPTRLGPSWATIGAAAVVAVVVNAVGTLALHHYQPKDGGAGEIPFYVVTGVIAWGIACLGLWRVRRSGTAGAVGVVFGVLGVLLWLVAYFTALPFTWGATALLLGRAAGPGRAAGAAKVLGGLAITLELVYLVARLAGFTGQM